jgi:predicted phosphodiesterase
MHRFYINTFCLLGAFLLNLNAHAESASVFGGNIVLIGHIHSDMQAFELAVQMIQKENPDQIFLMGDSITGNGWVEWSHVEKILAPIAHKTIIVPGAHDLSMRPGDLDSFKQKFKLTRSGQVGGRNFVVLNSAVSAKADQYAISSEQLE